MSFYNIIKEENVIYKGIDFLLVNDQFPVSPGHILIISSVVKKDFFELNKNEREQLPNYILMAKKHIEKYYTPDGYNIGMNCGEASGQTIPHFHCHVIPRYDGDMKNPKGGVRHCVEGKGSY